MPTESDRMSSSGREGVVTALLFALSVVLGVLANAISSPGAAAERVVTLNGTLFAGAGAILFLAWWRVRGWRLTMDAASFGIFSVVLVLLVASFFAAELSAIFFRADTLIWSESPFVTDIIKFRTGAAATLYSAPEDLSSFNYTPGAPFLTWVLASLVGQGDSIPAYRVVQVVFVVLATVLGVRTVALIRVLRGVERTGLPWMIAWFPLLFLAATNSLTNKFSYLLHNDALALLICAGAFLVIAEYAVKPRRWLLAAMVVLPAAGFMVKQSLGIWCVFFGAWLLFFGRPFRFWRAVWVGAGGLALILVFYRAGVGIWGADFRYWVIDGLGKHPVSPLRSIEHALDGWMFWAAGLWGGWVLIRGERASALLGLWLVWALLFAVETYTSGIAWMLNHMGPGSFLAVAWLAAALPSVWPAPRVPEGSPAWGWLRAGMVAATSVLVVSGLEVVQVPIAKLPHDADRYATAIEGEFAGHATASVLLDHGSWPYLREGIVQKDRSAPAGEAGWTSTANFAGLLERLRTHHYERILMRDLHDEEFMYDYSLWERSSGVRDSLLKYYREARQIPGVKGAAGNPWLRPVSVLEPRTGTDSLPEPR